MPNLPDSNHNLECSACLPRHGCVAVLFEDRDNSGSGIYENATVTAAISCILCRKRR